jgi:hypothetical protein
VSIGGFQKNTGSGYTKAHKQHLFSLELDDAQDDEILDMI